MKRFKYIILSIFSLATLFSCSDTEDIRNDIDNLNARLAQLEAQMPQVNENIALYQGLINDKYMIVGYAEDKDGDYILDLSNGESFEVNVHAGGQPTISIGEDGYWYYTYNNGVAQLLADENGNPVSATLVPQFKVDANGYWQYSFGDDVWLGGIGEADPNKTFGSVFSEVEFKDDKLILTWSSNGQTLTKEIPLFEGLYLTIPDLTDVTEPVQFSVGQTYTWTIEQGPKVEKIVIETIDWTIKVEETSMTVTAPKKNLMESDYVDKLVLKIFSKEGYCRAVTIPVKLLNSIIDENSATAWQNFLLKNEWNVLLDYSYAGYMHGKVAPPDGFALGYEVVNVKEYMDSKNLSAREAFIEILNENRLVRINGNTTNSNSNVRKVFYFPAGEYDMQPSGITDLFPEIYGGNFVIKGDGEGKTKIFMNSYIYNNKTAPLFLIKHTQSPTNIDNSKELAKITANVSKGSFSVNVSSTVGLSPDKWVQLRLRSANNDLLQKELGPIYSQKKDIWSITQQPGLTGDKNNNEDGKGVNIMEFHQIKSISGNTVTFYEPIMSDIDISYNDYDGGWIIRDYKYFENVGVENLTFVGNAVTPYYHHGEGATDSSIPEWMYDNGYMPLQFGRLINSWVRNVTFESVSEAMTFGESANCSAYNITIKGNRGHSAVRAQGSSRVFIGKVIDESSDTRGHGQWHGCGVSKPSIGTVIWNSNWGKDACFESHATQPRATLFDNCSGGLVRYHAGGAESENPNHLRDLTIWNLYVTGTIDEKNQNWSNDFQWWDATTVWWKIYPPILVGVHGTSITWDKGTDDAKQYTYEESTGTKVTPESLYEEQLRNRLGYLPAWLNALK
ncbi:DUF4955 domain-containing protein [Bacteroides caecigallinarum]|uniref:DUF4955 domain-containing protein n=1 Tax=Bacteroides caecigallinarum TaxID=1411144 RepID=UPI001F1C83DD|nr:DUF4955 domain-containing protein [Bacteroides caecigallinarum]MCF2594271.1 DUF4955 domain-containing protein [Bacteroides caecigallinarum]